MSETTPGYASSLGGAESYVLMIGRVASVTNIETVDTLRLLTLDIVHVRMIGRVAPVTTVWL